MSSFEDVLQKPRSAAALRVAERKAARRDRIEVLGESGGMARADEPERVASRIDRLARLPPWPSRGNEGVAVVIVLILTLLAMSAAIGSIDESPWAVIELIGTPA
jgi:hypothetical protein